MKSEEEVRNLIKMYIKNMAHATDAEERERYMNFVRAWEFILND